MPLKRHLSDRPVEDTYEDDHEFKKRKTHWHRGQINVIEDFIEMLNPVTSESLAHFNTWEEEENRWGVVGLDALVLEIYLEELVVAVDTEAMDAKVKEIDDLLAIKEGTFINYIDRAREKGDAVYDIVAGTLDDLTKLIEIARRRLPGMTSYWMDSHRKANC